MNRLVAQCAQLGANFVLCVQAVADRAPFLVPRADVHYALESCESGVSVVVGESGTGKSTMLAMFCQHARRHEDTVVVSHFVGASEMSNDPLHAIRFDFD